MSKSVASLDMSASNTGLRSSYSGKCRQPAASFTNIQNQECTSAIGKHKDIRATDSQAGISMATQKVSIRLLNLSLQTLKHSPLCMVLEQRGSCIDRSRSVLALPESDRVEARFDRKVVTETQV